jgi:hypothetical protein
MIYGHIPSVVLTTRRRPGHTKVTTPVVTLSTRRRYRRTGTQQCHLRKQSVTFNLQFATAWRKTNRHKVMCSTMQHTASLPGKSMSVDSVHALLHCLKSLNLKPESAAEGRCENRTGRSSSSCARGIHFNCKNRPGLELQTSRTTRHDQSQMLQHLFRTVHRAVWPGDCWERARNSRNIQYH